MNAFGPHSPSIITRRALEGDNPIGIKTLAFGKKIRDNEVLLPDSKKKKNPHEIGAVPFGVGAMLYVAEIFINLY